MTPEEAKLIKERELARIEEIKGHHTLWLQNPITKEALKLLDDMWQNCANKLSAYADDKAYPDNIIRVYARDLKTLKDMKRNLSNTELFVAVITTPTKQ